MFCRAGLSKLCFALMKQLTDLPQEFIIPTAIMIKTSLCSPLTYLGYKVNTVTFEMKMPNKLKSEFRS